MIHANEKPTSCCCGEATSTQTSPNQPQFSTTIQSKCPKYRAMPKEEGIVGENVSTRRHILFHNS